MNLETLLKLNRVIRVIGFDDAPFNRHSGEPVSVAGVVCGGTRDRGDGLGSSATGWVGCDGYAL
ncbi:hypothetical protein ACL6C3_21065 [Capilliphycus salinus ALCB114379]|uniref:hypothetical protein n=1 Tax=Capilliphycus salinus TaxID=2768948 RepID=UPI0039A54F55